MSQAGHGTDGSATQRIPRAGDGTGHTFGPEERELLERVLASGRLNCNSGDMCASFEKKFARHMEIDHALFVTSGTAAIHCAIGAIDPEPGEEIIVPPITDMGTIVPVLMQNCVPVFADVDPRTLCMDPDSAASKITSRTRAIIPVHLGGNVCDMGPLMETARAHDIVVIEDCAQAYEAAYRGQRVGTIGDMGCFSLNQSKHITCGDGGILVTSNDDLARRARLFSDKGWPREPGGGRGHLFLGPNYRVTELQAAVASAQLDRLKDIVKRRRELAADLTARLTPIPGIELPYMRPETEHSWWFYPIRVLDGGMKQFAKALAADGIPCQPGYIPKPVYEYEMLSERRTYGTSGFPLEPPTGRHIEYAHGLCPVAEQSLTEFAVIPWSQRFGPDEIERIATSVQQAQLNHAGATVEGRSA